MMAAQTILRILELQSELALVLVQKMTPEQVQGFVTRHEERIEWLRGLLDKAHGKDAHDGV